MINGYKILGVVPARGGSKGIPRKNLCDIGGKPLINWTITEGKKSRYIDRLIVSTDDSEIAQVAAGAGAEIPFLRPPDVSTDESPTIDVVFHALENLPGYDFVVLLQPTSPLRTLDDIDGCLEQCVGAGVESCASISVSDNNPCWMFKLEDERQQLSPVLGDIGNLKKRRQDLPNFYVLNGAVYVASVAWLKEKKSFVAEGTMGYLMPQARAIDIDDWLDLAVARLLVEKNRHLGADFAKS